MIPDPAPARNPALITGSVGDLVARAKNRQIYCTPTSAVSRALMTTVISALQRDCPDGSFVDARRIYRYFDDWGRRWPTEQGHYGAGIVVTRVDEWLQTEDTFLGLEDDHAIGLRMRMEIEALVRQGCPVALLVVAFPELYWYSRLAVKSFEVISRSRCAVLGPDSRAEMFRPVIDTLRFHIVHP
jgi:hypothetical protein